jgi:hypothetical protein
MQKHRDRLQHGAMIDKVAKYYIVTLVEFKKFKTKKVSQQSGLEMIST